jgi:Dictyostelium (slime mold) repeat
MFEYTRVAGRFWVASLALLSACGGISEGDNAAVEFESKTSALLTDPALVKPVLECVTQQGATQFTAFFGYSNTATEDVFIPVNSTSNKFTPSPIDRSQPTLFIPGRQRSVFSVQFNGSNLVWKLGPRTSTASSNSARCVVVDPCANPVGLDDGNPCTTDSCDPVLGVRHLPVAAGCSASATAALRIAPKSREF